MNDYRNFNLNSLMILTLSLLPMIGHAADHLGEQVGHLQNRMHDADARIATLESEQRKTIGLIKSVHTSLIAARQEMRVLAGSPAFNSKRPDATRVETSRTTVGHGRRYRKSSNPG